VTGILYISELLLIREVENNDGMLKVAVDFDKGLFKGENRGSMSLDDNFWEADELVTSEENDVLQEPFFEEEINKQFLIHILI
jgi:hypothetical protein